MKLLRPIALGFALSFASMACGASDGSEPSPTAQAPAAATSQPEETTPTPAPATETAEPEASWATPTPTPTAPNSTTIDLLHAVPSAVAVSTAYRGSADQAARLVDGDSSTAWNSESGDLVGAFIDVRLPEHVSVTGIALSAGFDRRTNESDLFTGNHRITRVRVTRGEETLAEQALDPDERGLQDVAFTGAGGDYRIEVLAVRPGSRSDWREICVSELRVMGTGDDARPGDYTPRATVRDLAALSEVAAEPVAAPAASVYFGFASADDERVIAKLSGGDFSVVQRGTQALCGSDDGTIWVGHSVGRAFEVNRIQGPTGPITTRLPAPMRGAYRLGCHAGGRLTAQAGSGWGEFDGSSWRYVAASEVPGSPRDVTMDAAGTTWALTQEGVFRRDSTGFVGVDSPSSLGPAQRFVAVSSGAIVVRHQRGLVRFAEGGWRTIDLELPEGDAGAVGATAIRRDGLVVASVGRGLVVRSANGSVRRVAFDATVRPDRVARMDFDDSGRLWMTTNAGLVVLAPDLSSTLRYYGRGSASALGGSLQELVAVGTMATLPESAQATGHVQGRLVHGGEPLPGQRFEFCAHPTRGSLGSMGSPCEIADGDGEYVVRGRSRDDGSFDLYGVPSSRLELATLRQGPRFFITRNLGCCTSPARESVELGDIDVP